MSDYPRYREALADRRQNEWAIGDALVKEAQGESDLILCERIAREEDASLSADTLRRLRNASARVKNASDRKLLSPTMWIEAMQTFPGQSVEVVRAEVKRIIQTEGKITHALLREERARRSQDTLTQWAELFVQNHEVAIEQLREADEETRTWIFRTFPEVEKYLGAVDALGAILGDVEGARERQSDTKAVAALDAFRENPVGTAMELLALRPSDRNKRLVTLLSAVPAEEEAALREEIEGAFREAVVIDPEAVKELTVKVEAHLTPQRIATALVGFLLAAVEPVAEANHLVSNNEDAVSAMNETHRDAILDALASFDESNSELRARLEISGIRYVSDILGGKA